MRPEKTDYVLKELFFFSLLGFLLNFVASSLLSNDLIKGDPVWMYCLGIFYQAIGFPFFCWLSWKSKRNMNEWITLPWNKLNVTYDKMYLGVIFGYWCKDMLNLSDALIVIHHVACMSCLLVCIYTQDKPGLGYFVVGTCVLEIGTAAYNIHNVGASYITQLIYKIVMGSSNLLAILMVIHYAKNAPNPKIQKFFFVLIVVALCIGRQREVLIDHWHAPLNW